MEEGGDKAYADKSNAEATEVGGVKEMLTLGSGSLDNVESLNDEEIALYGRDLIDVSD
jgi:hypothetical protein